MQKAFFCALAVFALPVLAPSAVIYQDDFSTVTVGALAGQLPWDQTGATVSPTMNVVAGDVDVAGLTAQAAGNSVAIVAGGQDVGVKFDVLQATDPGTTLYFSLTATVTDTAWVSPGGYFAHLTEGDLASGTGFRGRLWIDKGTTGFIPGIDISSGDNPALASGELAYGTPHFFVVKLTYNAGTNDDTAELFVNKVQSTEPVSADASETGVDFGAIGRFGLRQDSTNETPSIVVDRVRVGTTWADVVPVSSSVSEWSMY